MRLLAALAVLAAAVGWFVVLDAIDAIREFDDAMFNE